MVRVIEWAMGFGTFIGVSVVVWLALEVVFGSPLNAGAEWMMSGLAGLAATWFVTSVFGAE